MTIDSPEDLLKEIRAAFPASAYPGDAMLSDCWCEECEWSVQNLRGKSWMQLRIEDIGGEQAMLSPEAFRYYLPALLCLALRYPVESMLECVIVERLSVAIQKGTERAEEVNETVRRLTPGQRGVVERFLLWVAGEGLVDVKAALRTVRDGRVTPYDHEAWMIEWKRLREAAREGS